MKTTLPHRPGPGYLVKTKSGQIGRTYHSDEEVNGKMKVYLEDGNKLLCDPKSVEVIGFID